MANTKTEYKTFKISQLPEIYTSSIDDNDSMIITYYMGGDKHVTKRISMRKLLGVIAGNDDLMNALANNPDFINAILEDDQIDQQIGTKVDDKVKEAFDIKIIDGGNAKND